VSTRNVEGYRDAAVIAISQLSEVHIEGQLELIETANWFPRVMRKDYTVGVTVAEGGLDEPDQKFYEAYVCGAERNYTGYCNPETDRLIDRQSMEADPEKRRALVWEIERKLAEDASGVALFAVRHLHAAAPQRTDHNDEQPLQRLAHGRRLARQVALILAARPRNGGRRE
jgi:peptide/nickel transport system substrate-binding protein